MKRICECCHKEYDWYENQGNWNKFNELVNKKGGVYSSKRFCSFECGVKVTRLKYKQTCLKKYGKINSFQVDKYKEKIKQTNLERYGVEYSSQADIFKSHVKENSIKKYGVDNPNKAAIVKEHKQQTCLKKYGVTNNMLLPEFKEKRRMTWLKKYNTDNPMSLQTTRDKIMLAKKKNGTTSYSGQENEIKNILLEKFPNLKTQYKTELYPFYCDFYIPELDLYIEYQGYWSHGKDSKNKIYGPYDPNNPEHQVLVNFWKIKAVHNLQYKNAINVWTIRDPLKRETARKNNLNWIEFFTMDEFMEWYKNV